MRAGSWGGVAGLALLLATAAHAQSAQSAPPIRIDREVGAARELQLEAGQNRLLVLSEEIGRIAVADPRVADLKVVTPQQILLTAKGVGATDLTMWNRANQPLVVSLQVSKNLDRLRRQLKELFPGENVSVSGAGELAILSGQVSDVRMPERMAEVARLHANQIANLVQVTGNQQVQLEVRFAEVSRTGLRDIGLNLFGATSNGQQIGGMTGRGVSPGGFLGLPSSVVPPGIGVPVGQQPPPVYAPQSNQGFSLFFSNFASLPFSAMLNLLESNGLAKVLAEPTLVTLSGQEAKFLAGGEIPIPLASSLGSVQVEWKKFGIILNFTPTVISENTIHLKLAAEVSDVDPTLGVTIGGTTVPGLTSRQSETTVRLGNGQSFAVAGLLSDRVRSQIDKVPLLGSIPILGALFRSSQFRRTETELLVVITARLAEPMAAHQVPRLPTDFEANDPNDFQFFLMGSDGTTVDAPARPAAAGGPAGAGGFTR
jgi:pilus assembly protein CpaC